MKTFDVRAYSVSDFHEWYLDGKLELSPKFQRRSVWSATAKAFLADTIMRGKPFPKIILMQEFKDGRTIRIVVDGQQRLRAIFDFLNDGIKISRAHSREHAGKVFSQLPQSTRDEVLTYEVGCDVLNDAPISELLDIFARINRYTVKLNAQELRNAQYSGFFKTSAFTLGYEYVEYWQSSRILSQYQINRMAEAELASDLLAAFLVQIQSSKAIETTYGKFEDEEGDIQNAVERFRNAVNQAAQIYPDEDIRGTCWSSKHMYYSLVTCVGHIQSPISNVRATSLTPEVFSNSEKLKSILNGVSSNYHTYSPQPKRSSAPEALKPFIQASTLATTDTRSRIARLEYILSQLEAFH